MDENDRLQEQVERFNRNNPDAPDLVAEIERLTAELEEVRLTLAAEQGRAEGAPSEGWEFGYGWKDGNPTYLAWRKGRNEIRPCWEYDEPACWIVNGEPADTTARAAMRATDASK